MTIILQVLLMGLTLSLTSCGIWTYRDFPPGILEAHSITSLLPEGDKTFFYNLQEYTYYEAKVDVDGTVVPYPLSANPQAGRTPPNVTVFDLAIIESAFKQIEGVFRTNPFFAHARVISSPPETGIYGVVKLILKPKYQPIDIVAILPDYDSSGYVVEYSLYVDGKSEKLYRYEVNRKGVFWIGLLPFAWLNAFTTSAKMPFALPRNNFY